MTPAEHAALSAQVARAIGYCPESVRIIKWPSGDAMCGVYRIPPHDARENPRWIDFDYRDPAPLVEVRK